MVTGASSGLGLATAVQLAKDGNFVIMGCRDVAKGKLLSKLVLLG